jgi:hypothetical protein
VASVPCLPGWFSKSWLLLLEDGPSIALRRASHCGHVDGSTLHRTPPSRGPAAKALDCSSHLARFPGLPRRRAVVAAGACSGCAMGGCARGKFLGAVSVVLGQVFVCTSSCCGCEVLKMAELGERATRTPNFDRCAVVNINQVVGAVRADAPAAFVAVERRIVFPA